jgi:hypothetical protein
MAESRGILFFQIFYKGRAKGNTLFSLWIAIQQKLFPWLNEVLDPLTEKGKEFVRVAEWAEADKHIGPYRWIGNGRKPNDQNRWRIWDGPGSTLSKRRMPGLPGMPARFALTVQEQSVKIAVDREEGDVSVLEAEFSHRGKPRLLTRCLVMNLVRNLILVVETHDAAVVRFLFQRHMQLDRFFTETEPGSLFQRIHVWLREKLRMANCIPGSFSPIACTSDAHCRLPRAESNGYWGELEQAAELHAVNLQSVANWVQSGKR